LLLLGAFVDDGKQSDGAAAPALEAWTLALQLTEDEDDAVRRAVSAALGAAVAADAGASGAEQVCPALAVDYSHGNLELLQTVDFVRPLNSLLLPTRGVCTPCDCWQSSIKP
jgi:hypothetical protein